MSVCKRCEKAQVGYNDDFCLNCRWQQEADADLTPRLRNDLTSIKFTDVQTKEDKAWLQQKKSLYFTGVIGSGKTVYAAHLLLSSVDIKGLFGPRRFTFTPVLLQQLKSTFNNSTSESESDIIAKYSDAGVLVLDDFGVEKTTEWSYNALYLIINHRYEYLKPTIFTSNYTLDQIAEKLNDDRLPSRINSMCKVRTFEGVDFRSSRRQK
jgi:DNA replication protein DnaC